MSDYVSITRILVLALTLVCTACGGSSSPTAPTPVPPPTFTGRVTDTVTGASVTGYTATLNGSRVTISASGYLTRETANATTVDLIPTAAPFDLAFYRQMARNALDNGSPDVLRVRASSPSVYLQRTGLSDANVAALQQAALATIPALTGGRLSLAGWQVGDALPADSANTVVVELVNDPAQLCGRALIGGGHIWANVDRKCNFRGNLVDPGVFAHELGHTLGFGHVSAVGALMHVGGATFGSVAVTDQERYHAGIAYHRSAGNRDQDIDP